MALSNILREPRREITETVVGAAVVLAFLAADYEFALWLQDAAGGWNKMPWPAGMMIGLVGSLMPIPIVALAHMLGEDICDSLQRRGIRLRPRERWWAQKKSGAPE